MALRGTQELLQGPKTAQNAILSEKLGKWLFQRLSSLLNSVFRVISTVVNMTIICTSVNKPEGSDWGPIGVVAWATKELRMSFSGGKLCKMPFS